MNYKTTRETTLVNIFSRLFRFNHLVESSVNILLQTLKDNLNPAELIGLDKQNYPCLYPESKQAKNNKGNRCWECMPCCYWALFIFFNQRCTDALVKSTRQSLDAIKRRMQAASKHSKESSDAESKSPALFKVSACSAAPTLREVLYPHRFRLLVFLPSFLLTFPSFLLVPLFLSHFCPSFPSTFSPPSPLSTLSPLLFLTFAVVLYFVFFPLIFPFPFSFHLPYILISLSFFVRLILC